MRYGMSLPVSSWHAVVASTALEAPRTLRNSRRLTPVFCVSRLISVVAVRAVVPRLLAIGRSDRRGRGSRGCGLLLGRVAGRFDSLFRAVSVHMTAHAPAHVQARELLDAIHFLD